MNICLLQNFESIDTQSSLGGRYAYSIPYFDNGAATDGLHIGGACHEQGGSHEPPGLCQVQYRRGGCHLRIWTASAGRRLPVQLRHRRDSNTRLNLSLHSEVQFRLCPSITWPQTHPCGYFRAKWYTGLVEIAGVGWTRGVRGVLGVVYSPPGERTGPAHQYIK